MPSRRINSRSDICGGKPCIRGFRFPVSRILGLFGAGETSDSILDSYPFLESEDLREALRFGSRLADDPRISIYEEGDSD